MRLFYPRGLDPYRLEDGFHYFREVPEDFTEEIFGIEMPESVLVASECQILMEPAGNEPIKLPKGTWVQPELEREFSIPDEIVEEYGGLRLLS